MASIITDVNGIPITQESNFTKFCYNLTRKSKDGCKNCELCVRNKYIEIGLTETTTDVDFHDLRNIVNGLHAHGIHTSVDDFGVGYSSLNLIRQEAWDVVKIDKSFLPDVSDRISPQYLMFSHLLSMFRELGLKCIVEGVVIAPLMYQILMAKNTR